MLVLKRSVSVAVLAAVTMSVVGCQSFGPAGTLTASTPAPGPATAGSGGVIRADVTDIRPADAAPAGLVMTPMYDSPVQPVTYATVTPATVVIPASASAASTASAPTSSAMLVAATGSHTVRARETLFSIARSSYGDGKQWRKIAIANPGLSPSSLHIGQVITIP